MIERPAPPYRTPKNASRSYRMAPPHQCKISTCGSRLGDARSQRRAIWSFCMGSANGPDDLADSLPPAAMVHFPAMAPISTMIGLSNSFHPLSLAAGTSSVHPASKLRRDSRNGSLRICCFAERHQSP